MTESKASILQKFFALNSKPTKETFPELPNMVIWMRFVLAACYGFWLGTGTQRGGVGILFGLNFVTFVPILYCNTYLGVDSESYGNKYMFAGVPNSVALLLLIWIYFYTLDHADDEKKLASALAEFAVRTVTNIDVPAEETPNIARESIPDSEF